MHFQTRGHKSWIFFSEKSGGLRGPPVPSYADIGDALGPSASDALVDFVQRSAIMV